MKQQEIEDKVRRYYNEKLAAFGPSAQGVDWNGEASQRMRFEQLSKLIDTNEAFSLLDYGCGYGAMYAFLKEKYGESMSYFGYDLSAEMIAEAEKKFPHGPHFTTDMPSQQVDYVIASGIFNVRMEVADEDWENYIQETLMSFNQLTTKGFAFNILTAYSDPPFQKDYLYYAQPEEWFGYCKKHFSNQIALLHDYPLYEFSLIVRK